MSHTGGRFNQFRGRGGGRFGPNNAGSGRIPSNNPTTDSPVYNVCTFFMQRKCHNKQCKFHHIVGYLCWTKPHNNHPVTALSVIPGPQPKLLSGSSKEKLIKSWIVGDELTSEGSINVSGSVTDIEVLGNFIFWALNEPFSVEMKDVPVGIVHLFDSSSGATTPILRSEDMPYTDPFGNIGSFQIKIINDAVFVITGGESGVIRTWRFDSAQRRFELVGTLEGHIRSVTSLLLTDTLLWSASSDRTIRVWDMNSAQCVGMLSSSNGGHSEAVSSLVLIPPSQNNIESHVVSGGIEGDARLWKMNGELINSSSNGSPVTALCSFRDTHGGVQTIIIGLANGSLKVRALPSMQLLFSIDGGIFQIKHYYRIVDVGASCFATASQDGQIVGWNVGSALSESRNPGFN